MKLNLLDKKIEMYGWIKGLYIIAAISTKKISKRERLDEVMIGKS